MTDSAKLIERLRKEKARVEKLVGPTTASDLCWEAASALAALTAERDRLREALRDANDMCRSAYAIATRELGTWESLGGTSANTNWRAFKDRLQESLIRQHAILAAPVSAKE